MTARKRGRAEMEDPGPPAELSPLEKLRSTWEFSNLMQYIFIFGKAVKIDEDFDIEALETECLKPEPSQILADIGLALLKYVSSHRGLTPEIFDEFTRRQYLARAPERNPYGEDEEPLKFSEFDVYTKLKVLVQLSLWTFANTDRIREKMEENTESEQSVAWRINEIGYDKQERVYYVLDDNRLYRRTEAPLPPPPAPKPKANSKKGRAAARSSKRRRTQGAVEPVDDEGDEPSEATATGVTDDFGGQKWECIAISLAQYQEFLESIKKSRDTDEKALFDRITEDVMPIIEAAEASQQRRKQRQERELLNMQKLAGAKRSGRLEAKLEKDRQEREEREAEEKRKMALVEARAFEKKQRQMEAERESRMMTREHRLKERELKRILHEEELSRMAEEEKKVDAGESRLSERRLKAQMEKRKKELAELEEDGWFFDCAKCGVHGENLDDGAHSLACETCNVWQHSACLGIAQADAEMDDFHFVCNDCKRRAEDAKKPKIPALKFKVGSPPANSVAIAAAGATETNREYDQLGNEKTKKSTMPKKVRAPVVKKPKASPSISNGLSPLNNGPILSPQGQLSQAGTAQRLPNGSSHMPDSMSYSNGHGNSRPQASYTFMQAPNQSFQAPPFMTSNANHTGPQSSPRPGTYSSWQASYPTPPRPVSHQSPPQQSAAAHQSPGWSARYNPPAQQEPEPSAAGPVPVNTDPFAQIASPPRPLHSTTPAMIGRPVSVGNGSPFAATPALSPPQYRYATPSSSFHAPAPMPSIHNAPNDGSYIQPNGNLSGLPPVQSPIKHPSPPTAPRPALSPKSIADPPRLDPQAKLGSGISPIKQSSPPTSPPLEDARHAPPVNGLVLPPMKTNSVAMPPFVPMVSSADAVAVTSSSSIPATHGQVISNSSSSFSNPNQT